MSTYNYYEAVYNDVETALTSPYNTPANYPVSFWPVFMELIESDEIYGAYIDKEWARDTFLGSNFADDGDFARYAYEAYDVIADDEPDTDWALVDFAARRYALNSMFEELEALYQSIRTGATRPLVNFD